MEDSEDKIDDLNNAKIVNDIKKYIAKNIIPFYNSDNLIFKENTEDLKCAICLNILNKPISCSNKKNSHSFCKQCIDIYLIQNNKCPTCKLNFEYAIKNDIKNKLFKLSFYCNFKNEGCDYIISYNKYLEHINNCKYNNISFECLVKKYNYSNKKFEKCGYLGNKINIEKHLKLCALDVYHCIFCNEDILLMNLEEHFKNKCKIKLINYQDGRVYIGEYKNNELEGFGIGIIPFNFTYYGKWKNRKDMESYIILMEQ